MPAGPCCLWKLQRRILSCLFRLLMAGSNTWHPWLVYASFQLWLHHHMIIFLLCLFSFYKGLVILHLGSTLIECDLIWTLTDYICKYISFPNKVTFWGSRLTWILGDTIQYSTTSIDSIKWRISTSISKDVLLFSSSILRPTVLIIAWVLLLSVPWHSRLEFPF